MNPLLDTPGILDVPIFDELPKTLPPVAKKLGELAGRIENDPSELLKNGYLCRGGGLLLVGPTGIGKSAIAMQAAIQFALGKDFFGICPTRPLRSLVIQAENDEGDLAEMRDGVIAGLHLSLEDVEVACDNIIIATEDTRTGQMFCDSTLAPLLELHKPDLVWIDPALAYIGGDALSQKDVGAFLRNGLNPLLHKSNCGCVVIHHTNKPAKGREKPDWQAGDFAYLGAGSAEWANWARAVIAVRSVGSHKIFELCAAKRGGRIGWRDDTGEKVFSKSIGHSQESGVICWREVQPDELPTALVKRVPTAEELKALVPLDRPIAKTSLIDLWKDRYGNHQKGRAYLDAMLTSGELHEWRIKRPGTNAAKLIARKPQPAEQVAGMGHFQEDISKTIQRKSV